MKSLFISYNGALEPLVQSQGIPYLKGLSSKGIRSVLLTYEKTNGDKVDFQNKVDSLREELKNYNIEWFFLIYHKRPSLLATVYDIVVGTIKAIYIVIFHRIDIIHSRATVPALIGWTVSRLTGKRFLFDHRGLMAEEYVDGGMWRRDGVLHRLISFSEKFLLRAAQAIVVLCSGTKKLFEDTGYLYVNGSKKNNVIVIPTCVDTDRFQPQEKLRGLLRERLGLKDKFIFLYSGSVGTWYLLGEMLDFFKCALSIIPNSHFLFLINSGKSAVETACKEKGVLTKHITITGCDFHDVPGYISMSDVGVFFIKQCFSKRFSCPTKFPEYLSCGKPVLINRGIGDTAQVVDDEKIGVVIDRFTHEQYKSAVHELLVLQGDSNGILQDRCRNVAKKIYSLEKGVSLYMESYNKAFFIKAD